MTCPELASGGLGRGQTRVLRPNLLAYKNLKCKDFESFHQMPMHLVMENTLQESHLKPIKTFILSPMYLLLAPANRFLSGCNKHKL